MKVAYLKDKSQRRFTEEERTK